MPCAGLSKAIRPASASPGNRSRRPGRLLAAANLLTEPGPLALWRPHRAAGARPPPKSRPARPCRMQPLRRLSVGQIAGAVGHGARAGRQVDLAPRADARRAGHRPHHASPACLKPRTCSTPPRPLQRAGLPCRARSEMHWEVLGRGVGGLAQPAGDLDFGNSGTGSRLMMGVIAGHDMRARMIGDASLSRRPMAPRAQPLEQMGLEVRGRARRRLPLTLRGVGRSGARSNITCRCHRRRSSRPCCWPGCTPLAKRR